MHFLCYNISLALNFSAIITSESRSTSLSLCAYFHLLIPADKGERTVVLAPSSRVMLSYCLVKNCAASCVSLTPGSIPSEPAHALNCMSRAICCTRFIDEAQEPTPAGFFSLAILSNFYHHSTVTLGIPRNECPISVPFV